MNAHPLPPLDDRIAEALSREASSDTLATLIEEARSASEHAANRFSAARMEALDPSTPRAKVAEARQAMADAEFDAERLKAALMALERRHEQAVDREKAQRDKAERNAAVAERDALVDEFRREYPRLAGELADLLRRVKASDQRIARLNGAGGPWLNPTEAEARRVPAHFNDQGGPIAPLTKMKIPAFDAHAAPIWPPIDRSRTAGGSPFTRG